MAMVTGPSSGIGMVIAKTLAADGFHVIAAGRSEARVTPVVDEIVSDGGSAEFLHLDLASLESARRAGETFIASGRPLHLLVNNAGIGISQRGKTEDGFEVHFGINHLGHFLLTKLLLDAMGTKARVVQVASSVHFSAKGVPFDRLRRGTSLIGYREYAVSKLANVLFVRELARRWPDLATYAVHPGLVDTPLIPAWSKPFLRGRLLTPSQGAETPLWCATSDEVVDETGFYYAHRTRLDPSQPAQDDRLAAELWERSIEWCEISSH